jgi:lipopolysaccharide transport system permease protein
MSIESSNSEVLKEGSLQALREPPAAGASPRPAKERILILERGRAERNYWSDLWHYRELFGVLAWRDFAVRYKQTAVGVAWAVLRPLLTIGVLTIVFGRVAGLPSDGAAPYALMVAAGLLPWFLVTTILSEASASLVTNANLVGKVYFPRIIVPCACVGVALADFIIALVIVLGMAAGLGFWPNWRILLLPLFVAMAVLVGLGPGLLTAALNVKYRDFRYIIPFILQFGLYISPVGFSSRIVPEEWRMLFALNPVVGVIYGFRWSLLRGEGALDPAILALSLGISFVVLVAAVRYFRATEKTFADVL